MLNRIGKKLGYKDGGFTIIEVLIVLAVAGLIMAIVLVAIPQLQRNQRDTARRNVVDRVITELGNYAGNNNGDYPFTDNTEMTDFVDRYITNEVDISNPSTGNQYTLERRTVTTGNPTADQLFIIPGGTCNGEAAAGTYSANAREFAIRVQLEAGDIYYCADNNN